MFTPSLVASAPLPITESYDLTRNAIQPAIATGNVMPSAAYEVPFNIRNPPLEPFTAPSVRPVRISLDGLNLNDVLLGHGSGHTAYKHIGNERYRALVHQFLPIYVQSEKQHKMSIARSLVLIVRRRGGHFLEKDEMTSMFYEVGDEKAVVETVRVLGLGIHTNFAINSRQKAKTNIETKTINQQQRNVDDVNVMCERESNLIRHKGVGLRNMMTSQNPSSFNRHNLGLGHDRQAQCEDLVVRTNHSKHVMAQQRQTKVDGNVMNQRQRSVGAINLAGEREMRLIGNNDAEAENILKTKVTTTQVILGSRRGRKGDPRMHRAVNACLRNPTLSLYDALREGGFVFHPRPGTDPATATEVSLSQRKNQLARRLRSLRAKPVASHDVSNCDNAIDYEESIELMGLAPSIAPRLTLNTNHYILGKRKAADSFGHHFSYESELNPNVHDTTFDQTAYSQIMNLHNIDQDSSHTSLYVTTGASVNESIYREHSMRRVPPTLGPTPSHSHEPPKCNRNTNTTRTWTFSEDTQTNNTTLPPIPLSNSEYKTPRRSALEYYCKESSSLFKRCMLLAGFVVQQTDEFDIAYLRFLETVIDFEKKRLDELLSRSGRKDLGDMHDSISPTNYQSRALGQSSWTHLQRTT